MFNHPCFKGMELSTDISEYEGYSNLNEGNESNRLYFFSGNSIFIYPGGFGV